MLGSVSDRSPRRALGLTSVVAAGLMASVAASACGASRGAGDTAGLIPELPGDGAAPTDTQPSDPGATAGPWANRDDLIAAPEPLPPRAVELPPVTRFTLKNGLQVIAIENDAVPVVEVQLAIKVGRADSPRAKVGVERFAASMLRRGTRTRDARTIARTIDAAGGVINANANFDATVVSCKVLSRDLRTCLTLLPDIVINPAFPAEEMDRVRRELRATLRQRRDSAGLLATAHFRNLLWGEQHVRGWPMSAQTINSIVQEDLQNWHKTWFLPNNAVIAVAGDIDIKSLRSALEPAFASWRRGKVPKRAQYPEPALADSRVRLVDKPGQTQTHIRIGHLGITANDPDFFATQVFNYALGGGNFSSRLVRVIRAEAGKSYGAVSQFERNRTRGSFMASTFTRNAETLATVRLVLDELAKMQQKGPTDAEVRDAITHLAGRYATRFESALDAAEALLLADVYGLGSDYVRDFPLTVAQVTTEAARQAAAKRLIPNRVAVVLVGDARDIEPQLRQVGLPYQKVGHLEPIAADERDPAAAINAEALAAGQALLAKALAAKGGESRLRGIKRQTTVSDGVLRAGAQQRTAKLTRRYLAPDKLRVDLQVKLPGTTVEVITVLNGTTGWNKQPPVGVTELQPLAVAELQKQMWRDPDLILLRAKEAGAKVAARGSQTRDGRSYKVLRVVRGDGAVSADLFLDPKTHLLRFMTYTEQGVATVESYSDYKVVKGIQIAYTRTVTSGDSRLDIKINTVRFDDELANALFAKP